MLEAAFGLGSHTVVFDVSDKAGAFVFTSALFLVESSVPVPEPESSALMMLGLLLLTVARRRSLFTAR